MNIIAETMKVIKSGKNLHEKYELFKNSQLNEDYIMHFVGGSGGDEIYLRKRDTNPIKWNRVFVDSDGNVYPAEYVINFFE